MTESPGANSRIGNPWHARSTRFMGDSVLRPIPQSTSTRSRLSFRQRLAGAAELLRKVLQLRQAVLHGQDGLGVVHVHAGHELQGRNRRGVDVDETERRMVGHKVAAALGAVLALAD